MAADKEPAKLLVPYLQRADELLKHDPLVAYYCRLYAMEKGLTIPQNQRTKNTNSLLISLMNQLEKDKKLLKLGPDDNLYLEGFALSVFGKADKQDRAGLADLNTAKTFYAASIFFDILNQFGSVQPDLEQKQKYAVWKAAEIRKALSEGRKPIPGPSSDDQHLSLPPGCEDVSSIPPLMNCQELVHPHFPPLMNCQAPMPNIPPLMQDLQACETPTGQADTDPSPYLRGQQQHITACSSNSFISESHSTGSFSSDHELAHHLHPGNTMDGSYLQPRAQSSVRETYPSDELPSHSYPNFQSYPSFADANLAPVPSHSPCYQQGLGSLLHAQSLPPSASYPSSVPPYSESAAIGWHSVTPANALSAVHGGRYQPLPETIAEAHKAAKLAVGALAFDDVPVAVDYLKKSLELLTNPTSSK